MTPCRVGESGGGLDADHQPLSERREGGIKRLGLSGVARVEQPLNGGRTHTRPPRQFRRGEARSAERQVKDGLGGDQPARGDGRPSPYRRRFGNRRAAGDPSRQRLFQAVDGAGEGLLRGDELGAVSRSTAPFRQLHP